LSPVLTRALSLVLRLVLSLVLFLQYPCRYRQNLSKGVFPSVQRW
jgi:hypothetical protein